LGVSGFSSDYDNPARKHAEEGQTERSGQAERGNEEVPGSSPAAAIQPARTPKKTKPSAAARPSAAENGDSGASPDYGNPSRTHAEEDQAERSGQAERCDKGWSGVSPGCDSGTRPFSKEAKRSDHAERSGKRVPFDGNSNQRATKVRTNAERPAACKTKGLYLCFDISSDQGASRVAL
jgi:hypothetical protein